LVGANELPLAILSQEPRVSADAPLRAVLQGAVEHGIPAAKLLSLAKRLLAASSASE
jgi:hypothetical protein